MVLEGKSWTLSGRSDKNCRATCMIATITVMMTTMIVVMMMMMTVVEWW
jgi:hypothetical protein